MKTKRVQKVNTFSTKQKGKNVSSVSHIKAKEFCELCSCKYMYQIVL